MRKVLLVLLVSVVGLAAPQITPTPFRFGLIYWVGMNPLPLPRCYPSPAGIVATMFEFFGFPSPETIGEWWVPEKAEGADREALRAQLVAEGKLSPSGFLAPTLEPDTYWIIRPLKLGEREISPLVLMLFPDVEHLNAELRNYMIGGLFVPDGEWECAELPWEPWICELLGRNFPPTVFVAFVEITPEPFISWSIFHEIAHWVFHVWLEENGVPDELVPPLLLEGLAEYTEAKVSATPEILVRCRELAAVWAQEGSLVDTPFPLIHEVGASLVEFLVQKMGWKEFLSALPSFILEWENYVAAWEPEWRAWLPTKISDRAQVLYQAELQLLGTCAAMVNPLFPEARKRVQGIRSTEDIVQFWNFLEGPVPGPSPELWAALERREFTFLHVAKALGREDLYSQALELLADLQELREEGNWEKYVALFLRGVREIVGRVSETLEVPVP